MNRINAADISTLLESTISIEKDLPSTAIKSVVCTNSILSAPHEVNSICSNSYIKSDVRLKERSIVSESLVLADKQLAESSLYLVEESNIANILTSYDCANDVGERSEESMGCRTKYLDANTDQAHAQYDRSDNLEVDGNKTITPGNKLTTEILTVSTNHKEIIDSLANRQKFLNIDKESYETMIDSIKFAGIDTLKEAQDLNLRIISPGPVFHTWWARYGAGIFDGDNNPSHAKGLNYVKRIEEQADRLKQWDIPVFIVYVEYNMLASELVKMRTLFREHDNIIMLSLEKDLDFIIAHAVLYSFSEQSMLDDLRHEICRRFPAVLAKVKKHAESKPGYIDRLDSLGGNSIIYSDIDNTFIRRPQYQIVSNGYRQASVIHKMFTMSNEKHNYYMSAMSINHRGYFSHEGYYLEKLPRFSVDYLLSMADSLYDYLLSGKALDVYRKINWLHSDCTPMVFFRDVGYIIIDRKSLDDSKKNSNNWTGIDWECSLVNSQNTNIKISYT